MLSTEPDLTNAQIKERLGVTSTKGDVQSFNINQPLFQSSPDGPIFQGSEVFGGTDAVAPVLAGTVGTLLSIEPDLTPEEVKSRLVGAKTESGGLDLRKLYNLEG